MSADLLREAARLMRERAKGVAVTGVWRGDPSDTTTPNDGAFTHHVATFGNPAVALAVADWLDQCADRAAVTSWARLQHDPAEQWWLIPTLAVARAYLGAEVPA